METVWMKGWGLCPSSPLPLPFPCPLGWHRQQGRPRAVGMGAVKHFPLGSDISQRKFPGSLSHAGILLGNPGSPTCDKNPESRNQNIFPPFHCCTPQFPFSSPRTGVPGLCWQNPEGWILMDPFPLELLPGAARCLLAPPGNSEARARPGSTEDGEGKSTSLKDGIIPSAPLCAALEQSRSARGW